MSTRGIDIDSTGLEQLIYEVSRSLKSFSAFSEYNSEKHSQFRFIDNVFYCYILV